MTSCLFGVGSALAAPLPEAPALSEKYLLDDTDLLAVVNVKQILASPLFKKNFEKLVSNFLKSDASAALLKDSGFSPLKDVERVYFMMGPSCWPDEKPGNGAGPVFVLQGQFDAVKLHAAAGKLVDEGKLKVQTRGDSKIFEIQTSPRESFFAAVLDKGHVILAMNKTHIETALDKAAGKKKTALTSKAFAVMFDKIKAVNSVTMIASSDAVMGASSTAMKDPSGNIVVTNKFHTLGDEGMQAMQVQVDVADIVKVRASLKGKDGEKARVVEKNISEGLKQAIAEMEKRKELPALAAAFKTVKVEVKDLTLTIEGQGDADAVQQLVLGFFTVRGTKAPAPNTPAPAPIKD